MATAIFLGCIGCTEEDIDDQIENQSSNIQLSSEDVIITQEITYTETDTEESMPVPSELSDDPNDTDWVFDGYFQEPTEEELIERKEKASYINSLSDDEYKLYKEQRRQEKLAARCLEAKLKNKKCDERDDQLVTILPNQQVWRLRGSLDSVSTPADIEPYEGTADIQYFKKEIASGLPFFADNLEFGFSSYTPMSFSSTGIRELSDSARSILESKLFQDDNSQLLSEEDPAISFTVFGSDGRIRVYPTTGYPARTHGMFTPENADLSGNPLSVTCSGTKISARVVITAGHCLYKDGSWKARWWIPGADSIGNELYGTSRTPNGVKYMVRSYVHASWLDDADERDDMGWFVLRDNQNSCDLGWLGARDESGLNNDTVNLWGYPGQQYTCADAPTTSPINGKCYASMYRQSGEITAAGTQTLHYLLDTQKGASGAGLYKYYSSSNSRYVIGINRAQTSSYNKGLRLNSNKMSNTNWVVDNYPSSICE